MMKRKGQYENSAFEKFIKKCIIIVYMCKSIKMKFPHSFLRIEKKIFVKKFLIENGVL